MFLGIRSGFFRLLTVCALALSALPLAVTPAGAAPATAPGAAVSSAVPFESVTVAAHDEQQTTMLFITGVLAPDVPLPARIELPAPAQSQLQWAGEILGGDLSNDITAEPVSTTAGDTVVHAFTLTKARTAQIEAPTSGIFTAGASVTDVKLLWAPITDTPSVTLQVRLPESAGISVPAEGAQTTPADPGYVYYSKTFTDAKAGVPLELALSFVPGASASGAGGAGAGAAGAKGGEAVPIAIALVALLAFLWFGFKVSRKATVASATDAADAEDTDDDDDEGVARAEEWHADEVSVDAPVAPVGARRSKLPLYLTLAVVGLVVVLAVVTSMAGGGVGTKQVTADAVSQVVADVDADSTVVVPISMSEGGDVEHESEHVFKALQTTVGVRKVSVALDGRSVTVEFAAEQVAEAQIREALAAGGYPPQDQ